MKKLCNVILVLLCLLTIVNKPVIANEEVSIRSEYAIVINLNDNRIMYEKNINELMYPASMTKMMSVLVAIENIKDLTATYTFDEDVFSGLAEANASVAGFMVGDVVTYEDLLYGIMLPSGADASRAIAFSLFGSEEGFVEKMNQKAQELKMEGTHYVNTSGLHDDNHYSTVSDLAILLNYAIKNETFKKIFTTHSYVTSDGKLTFSSTFSKQKQSLYMDVSMIKGTKTGFTNAASLCLASYAEVDGEEYIAITAQTNSSSYYPYHIEDTASLYAYFYSHFDRITYLNENDLVIEIPVKHGFEKTYQVNANKNISILCKNLKNVKFVWMGLEEIEPPLKEKDYIGTLLLMEDDEIIYKQNYYMSEDMKKNMFSYYFAHPFIFIKDYAVLLIIITIFTYYCFVNKKKQKRRKKVVRKRRTS